MAEIVLRGKRAAGRITAVDDCDADTANQHQWRVMEQVRPSGTRVGPYAVTDMYVPAAGRTRTMYLHRLLMPGARRVDHRDGNGLNNRRDNLRDASTAQNNANRPANRRSTSPYKGVCWHDASHLWMARIKRNGRSFLLGYFHDQAEAARAYDAAARDLFGEFARLNFPGSGV